MIVADGAVPFVSLGDTGGNRGFDHPSSQCKGTCTGLGTRLGFFSMSFVTKKDLRFVFSPPNCKAPSLHARGEAKATGQLR